MGPSRLSMAIAQATLGTREAPGFRQTKRFLVAGNGEWQAMTGLIRLFVPGGAKQKGAQNEKKNMKYRKIQKFAVINSGFITEPRFLHVSICSMSFFWVIRWGGKLFERPKKVAIENHLQQNPFEIALNDPAATPSMPLTHDSWLPTRPYPTNLKSLRRRQTLLTKPSPIWQTPFWLGCFDCFYSETIGNPRVISSMVLFSPKFPKSCWNRWALEPSGDPKSPSAK